MDWKECTMGSVITAAISAAICVALVQFRGCEEARMQADAEVKKAYYENFSVVPPGDIKSVGAAQR